MADPNSHAPRLKMIAKARDAGVAKEMDALLKNPEVVLDDWGQPLTEKPPYAPPLPVSPPFPQR